MCAIQPSQRISSTAHITPHYWESASPLATKNSPCGSFLILEMSHLACRLMVFALSSVGTRLLGHSFCSITISLLKKGFTRKISSLLDQFPRNPLTWIHFCGRLSRNFSSLKLGSRHSMHSCSRSSLSMHISLLFLVIFQQSR